MQLLPQRVRHFFFVVIICFLTVSCVFAAGCNSKKTTTFTGKSAHWKATYTEQVRKVKGSDWQTESQMQLDIWWMGPTTDTVEKAKYKLVSDPDTVGQTGGMSGNLHPFISRTFGKNMAATEASDKLDLTITWNGTNAETITMSSH